MVGPIEPAGKYGFRFALAFTDDYSGAVFTYFLKTKSYTVKATERFISDVAPYGKIKCIRSDNGTEFTSSVFESLLSKNTIRHETSAPYSPHQNGTAERAWRTLFEMARCMLIESKLPKELWTYVVQTAAIIRNRCYNRRLGQTPYNLITGKKPDLSKMKVFGVECCAYKYDKKKLDTHCKKGIFVGYDKNSPAYLVFYPDTGKVLKNRLVKFVTKSTNECDTQTEEDVYEHFEHGKKAEPQLPKLDMTKVRPQEIKVECDAKTDLKSESSQSARYAKKREETSSVRHRL